MLQAGDSKSRKVRGKLGPRDGILYQTASRLPVTNQVFLGSWTADIHQECRSQRSAPQTRHTAHLLRVLLHTQDTERLEWGCDKMHHTPGGRALAKPPGHLSCSDLWGHKTQVQPSLHLCGVPENLNGLDLGSARNPGPALDSSPAEQPGAWAV